MATRRVPASFRLNVNRTDDIFVGILQVSLIPTPRILPFHLNSGAGHPSMLMPDQHIGV